ncbi:MAG TPA: serine/threonine-protein kinase [Oligoflexia bacterium]|nr:serine/threonine-protein kinase [Oligoflexia bacterium]HMP26626.1 serine/threonine-protein kinase [Oligoflexia bacterium]
MKKEGKILRIDEDTILYDRFKVIAMLQKNSAYDLFLCVDSTNLDRRVVIKRAREIDSDLAAVHRLNHEIVILREIDHLNVMKVSETFPATGFPILAYAMEYAERGSLSENIAPRSLRRWLNILYQVASGLAAIHDRGVLHRDIKPDNILISANDRVVISDFNIAIRFTEPDQSYDQRIVGSVNYVSPEYVALGKSDITGDIYSLGVTAFQLFTGRFPFENKHLLDNLTAKVKDDPPKPSTYNIALPAEIDTFVLKCIARAPDARYQSSVAVVEALNALNVKLGFGEIDQVSLRAEKQLPSMAAKRAI